MRLIKEMREGDYVCVKIHRKYTLIMLTHKHADL